MSDKMTKREKSEYTERVEAALMRLKPDAFDSVMGAVQQAGAPEIQ